jgi:hypothetical protein
LRLVNAADFDLLYDVVGLSRATAYAIAYADERPIRSLAALDALPHVGPIAFDRLKRNAVALGYGPGLAEEYPPDGEDAAIARTIEVIGRQMAARYPSGRMLRNQHAKAHGCVQATFIVGEEVPDALRQGVFATPAEYPAWVRFSNGDSVLKADKDKDVRGFAVKVIGVLGFQVLPEEADSETQDFLLINHPTLMVRNVLSYADFTERAASGNQFSILSYFLGLNPADWEVRGLKNLLAMVGHEVASPLETRYWSTTPYLLGSDAVKYSAVPCQGGTPMPESPSENYLHEALAAHLSRDWACFELQVQLQTDPQAMPIEDPTVEWSESRSPFVTVARVEIPPQGFASPEQQDECENFSFTPWHAIDEHRPLGGINRARRDVYRAMAAQRRERSGASTAEPR